MRLGPIALPALLLIAAVLFDVILLRWLQARRGGGRAGPRPLTDIPWVRRLLRAWISPLPDQETRTSEVASARAAPLAAPFSALVRYIREEVLHNPPRLIRVLMTLAGLAVSWGIGLAHADDVMVSGWQLWAWLAAVAVTAAALMPPSWPPIPRGHPWGWLGALVLAGVLLRVLFLETIPGGLHVDEAGLANYTLLHVFPRAGLTVSPFVTGSAVQPTLHSYIVALALRTLGQSITALRIPSVVAGSLAIVAVYAALASIDNRRAALLAAAVTTTYHFHIHWSRLALNNIWDTMWVPLILAAFAWGWKRRWSGGAVLAGLALGFSQYFYAGNKISLFLIAIVIVDLWRKDPDRRRLAVHLGKTLAVAVCVAAPLAAFAILNPDLYFARTRIVMGWYPEAVLEVTGRLDAWWEYFWHQVGHSFGAYVAYPDITGFYGPGVPLVFGLALVIFLVGVIWALHTRRWLVLAWVALTALLGGFIMRGAPSSSHFVVSIPAIVWLLILPLDALIARGRWRLALSVMLAIMLIDLVFYFGVYVPGGPSDLDLAFPTRAPPGG